MRPDPASALDLISLWMDSPLRRLDFAVTVALPPVFGSRSGEALPPDSARSAHCALRLPIDAGQLLEGARRARLIYPRADCKLDCERWVPAGLPPEQLLSVREIDGEPARREAIRTFLEPPLDPSREAALRQLLLVDRSGRAHLVTRSHHAATDLMGAFFFLAEQLDPKHVSPPELALRSHDHPVRKSRFAHRGPSARLWTRDGRARSPRREVQRFDLDASLRAALKARSLGFTYNDLLGVAALQMLRRFQEQHESAPSRLSLWFPVNVRRDPWSGFGNGSSRIRIYERHLGRGTFAERASAFREQVAWSKEHGEWAVPERHPLLRLPASLRRPVLRAYFHRPWVDMGTMLFSHAERLGPDRGVLSSLTEVEIQANLDRRHAVALTGVTLAERTELSMTYDPSLLEAEDVAQLIALFVGAVEAAKSELL